MTLFQTGDFTLASGQQSRWKIECDALTTEDWQGLAAIAAEILPPFCSVHGVPRGGYPFAEALEPYITPNSSPVLIADDVWTTGGSWHKFVKSIYTGRPTIGVVAFARKPIGASNITALFTMGV